MSSSTAQSSFHGTGISIVQFPKFNELGNCRDIFCFQENDVTLKQELLRSYAIIPAVVLNHLAASVPMVSCQEYCGLLEGAKIREDSWLEEVSKLLKLKNCSSCLSCQITQQEIAGGGGRSFSV